MITARTQSPSGGSRIARGMRKFLRFFPDGFVDETYLAWERDYKWQAHLEWEKQLGEREFRDLMRRRDYLEIAARAVRIESRTNLLFSFEKMALRDAVKTPAGARLFADALFDLLFSKDDLAGRFTTWIETVGSLPRKQTRVLTWPLVTVFGFIAQPKEHIFLKPNVTKVAAAELGLIFNYQSRPSFEMYAEFLTLARDLRRALKEYRPRDMIDIQSFLWVQGSSEYD